MNLPIPSRWMELFQSAVEAVRMRLTPLERQVAELNAQVELLMKAQSPALVHDVPHMSAETARRILADLEEPTSCVWNTVILADSDRDRQARAAAIVDARPIATAPVMFTPSEPDRETPMTGTIEFTPKSEEELLALYTETALEQNPGSRPSDYAEGTTFGMLMRLEAKEQASREKALKEIADANPPIRTTTPADLEERFGPESGRGGHIPDDRETPMTGTRREQEPALDLSKPTAPRCSTRDCKRPALPHMSLCAGCSS